MLTFNTKAELRRAVESKLRYKLSNDTWMMAQPDWGPPYDGEDMREVLNAIRKDASESEIPARMRRGAKKAKDREKVEKLELYHWRLYWFTQDPRAKGKANQFWAQRCRKILGLSEPIPLAVLEGMLRRLGAKETVYSRKVFFPRRPEHGEYVEVGFLYYHPPRAQILSKVCDIVDVLVNNLGWHPAEALAFLLCDIAPVRPEVPRIYKQGREITIKVRPNVKPESLARLYSEVRNETIKEIRGIRGKRARPRALSERVRMLLDFCRRNPTLKGEKLLTAWEKEHYSWRYTDSRSISVVLSRARKKIRQY